MPMRALRQSATGPDFNLFFIETPLPSDDLAGYARIAKEQPIPIAAGEWLATRFEFLDLMDRGQISVVQPDIGRVGGLTEAKRVCQLAQERGLTVVPHLWKSGISIAAAAHLAATTLNCAYIEFLPPRTRCANQHCGESWLSTNCGWWSGVIPLPEKPGLGIELNRNALNKFEREADRAAPRHETVLAW